MSFSALQVAIPLVPLVLGTGYFFFFLSRRKREKKQEDATRKATKKLGETVKMWRKYHYKGKYRKYWWLFYYRLDYWLFWIFVLACILYIATLLIKGFAYLFNHPQELLIPIVTGIIVECVKRFFK